MPRAFRLSGGRHAEFVLVGDYYVKGVTKCMCMCMLLDLFARSPKWQGIASNLAWMWVATMMPMSIEQDPLTKPNPSEESGFIIG